MHPVAHGCGQAAMLETSADAVSLRSAGGSPGAVALRASPGPGFYLSGAIAAVVMVVLPRSAEALGIAIAFVVGSALLGNVRSLHAFITALPVHYWLRWTSLFHGRGGGLAPGLTVQAATVAIVMAAACTMLARRDPAA